MPALLFSIHAEAMKETSMLPDFASTFALHAIIVGIFSLGLHAILKRPVNGRAVAVGLAVLFVYFAAVLATAGIQGRLPIAEGLHFNWSGKILAILLTLLMMAAVPKSSAVEMGLTIRQRSGSILPSILVSVGLCVFAWGVTWLVGDARAVTTERLLYQATLPGLDEELFFRGLLFALFLRAFADESGSSGGPSWPAMTVVTFLFAAGHALVFQKGSLAFDPIFFGYVALLGFGLLWIRQRTGSLLLPVLAHNVINVGATFVPA
jgi:membrane protease YdiL (CAAX protease family)